MRILLGIIPILFLQSLYAQNSIQLKLTQEQATKRWKAPIIHAKDTVSFKVSPGNYYVEFVRPNDYLFRTFDIYTSTGQIDIAYRPHKDFFHKYMWMRVSSGLFKKWYRVVYETP